MVDPMPTPDDCFSCAALREENARLREEARLNRGAAEKHYALAEARAESLEACMESDARHRAEVKRLGGLILDAESDIKAMGFEAHPAVLMRLDRLVRNMRGTRHVSDPDDPQCQGDG